MTSTANWNYNSSSVIAQEEKGEGTSILRKWQNFLRTRRSFQNLLLAQESRKSLSKIHSGSFQLQDSEGDWLLSTVASDDGHNKVRHFRERTKHVHHFKPKPTPSLVETVAEEVNTLCLHMLNRRNNSLKKWCYCFCTCVTWCYSPFLQHCAKHCTMDLPVSNPLKDCILHSM